MFFKLGFFFLCAVVFLEGWETSQGPVVLFMSAVFLYWLTAEREEEE